MLRDIDILLPVYEFIEFEPDGTPPKIDATASGAGGGPREAGQLRPRGCCAWPTTGATACRFMKRTGVPELAEWRRRDGRVGADVLGDAVGVFAEPVARALDVDDDRVMEQAVEQLAAAMPRCDERDGSCRCGAKPQLRCDQVVAPVVVVELAHGLDDASFLSRGGWKEES